MRHLRVLFLVIRIPILQYYLAGTEALYFYDYFLTLEDEVRPDPFLIRYSAPNAELFSHFTSHIGPIRLERRENVV